MLDTILRFMVLHVVCSAERTQEEQFKLPGDEKTELMEKGQYVYCSDVWDLKESLGLPLRKVEKNTWASIPLSELEF